MKEELRQTTEAIASHPKTAVAVAAGANFNSWWLSWGSPIVDAVTSILGIVLVSVLIRYHWQNTKKIIKENNQES
jgi:hypothetical protein